MSDVGFCRHDVRPWACDICAAETLGQVARLEAQLDKALARIGGLETAALNDAASYGRDKARACAEYERRIGDMERDRRTALKLIEISRDQVACGGAMALDALDTISAAVRGWGGDD